MWRAPIFDAAVATALTEVTVTTRDAEGDAITHSTALGTAPVSQYSTAYCRKGANKGLYRVITTGATGSQVPTICFPYDIEVGDIFVCANVILGPCRFDFSTYILGIDGTGIFTEYMDCFCHELNLEISGKEYAVISIAAHHVWKTR
jgi:hypothetical protein